MRISILRIASGCVTLAALTGCTCGHPYVVIQPAGPGEQFRGWMVGDTASVWAESRAQPSGPDAMCTGYAVRAAPGYHGPIEPDRFTFASSRPDVATVTNQGLVTGLQVGQTDLTAMSAGAVSPVLTITVQAAAAGNVGAPPNMRLKLTGAHK